MPKKPVRKKKPDEDAELIEAINSGQHTLFYDLVKRYEQKLYNFGFRFCQDVRDAEDLVQETFLNVFRYLKDFRYETKFKNWLFKIASSVCIKKRRKSKFAPEKELSLEDFLPDETQIPQRLPNWATAPLEQLLSEELSDRLRKAILSLPEKYRIVILLRDMEGFSTDETAQILNVTPANVKVRLHRARLALREKLKDYYEHEA
ncbi:MAG: RNA polymerase sigma factor [Deltaproteobacteria bacterium]|nr:RNA polymerase sigma factor [Deltaproteobacteria bacterium]MBW1960743.1 RNA polymerase sigma factor [Deltaproteobacteria bacterium]MBW1995711.1 RNA polymerase sigma factor [Deltaproteobacteria bacterium]MBW2152615.1 RNA polymerase sigma factor [Deltaproteobacteria bacterium]